MLRSCWHCKRTDYEEMVRADIREELCALAAEFLDLDLDAVTGAVDWDAPGVTDSFNALTEVVGVLEDGDVTWVLIHLRRHFMICDLANLGFLSQVSRNDPQRFEQLAAAADVVDTVWAATPVTD